MWARPAQLTGPSSAQEEVGQSQPRIFSFLVFWAGLNPAQTLGLGQHWPGPYAMLIICGTWIVVHILHATEMAAKMEIGGGEDYRERWSRMWSGGWVDGFGGVTRGTVAGVDHRGRKKDFAEVRKRKKRWLFQAWGGRLVVGLATCDGDDGGETDENGRGGWRPRWREKEERGLQ
jgi:hypothetical protein